MTSSALAYQLADICRDRSLDPICDCETNVGGGGHQLLQAPSDGSGDQVIVQRNTGFRCSFVCFLGAFQYVLWQVSQKEAIKLLIKSFYQKMSILLLFNGPLCLNPEIPENP